MDLDELKPWEDKWVVLSGYDSLSDSKYNFYINNTKYSVHKTPQGGLKEIREEGKFVRLPEHATLVTVQVYRKKDSFFDGYLFLDSEGEVHLTVGQTVDLDDHNPLIVFQKEFNYINN